MDEREKMTGRQVDVPVSKPDPAHSMGRFSAVRVGGRESRRVGRLATVTAAVLASSAAMAPWSWAQTRAARPGSERQQRYQIAVMERVLEGAVEHGAALTRDRLKAFMPADMLLAANAQARGFRLEGYGVFFDVAVPSLEGALPWTFRMLDQSNLGLDSALRTIRSFVESSQGDSSVEQALKRLELQVAPLTVKAAAPGSGITAVQAESQAQPQPQPTREAIADPILENPQEAYRAEIRDTLMDAMLEHGRSLSIAATEWLTVAARRSDDRPRLSPVETDSTTVIIRASGADLVAFLSGQISRDEARKRMHVRVF